MDIGSIKPSEIVLEILHPASEQPLGIRVFLVSMSDERVKKVRRRIQDEKLKLDARGKHFKASEVEENTNSLIFNCMSGWEWYNPTGNPGDEGYDKNAQPNFNGEIPDYNKSNVYAVFNELDWFSDQIAAALADEKAFFQASKAD